MTPRPFELRQGGSGHVSVGMKEIMQESMFSGLSTERIFRDLRHHLFVNGIPQLGDVPPFELKVVDAEVLSNTWRYATRQGVLKT